MNKFIRVYCIEFKKQEAEEFIKIPKFYTGKEDERDPDFIGYKTITYRYIEVAKKLFGKMYFISIKYRVIFNNLKY